MKKQIPNVITSCNLISGCIASVLALQGGITMLKWSLLFIILAAIFDFFDGFIARIVKSNAEVGKELDSLADCLSFGFAPSAVVFVFLQHYIPFASDNYFMCTYVPYLAFLIAAFSALRLAKFNVDIRQKESFIGLATPANTLFWVSFCAGIVQRDMLGQFYVTKGFIITILLGIFVFSFLLISELPMFSLKVKHFGIKGNIQRYSLFVFAIVLFPFIGYLSIAGSMLLYVAFSIGNLKFSYSAQ